MRCKCEHLRDFHEVNGKCIVLSCKCKQFNREFYNEPNKRKYYNIGLRSPMNNKTKQEVKMSQEKRFTHDCPHCGHALFVFIKEKGYYLKIEKGEDTIKDDKEYKKGFADGLEACKPNKKLDKAIRESREI